MRISEDEGGRKVFRVELFRVGLDVPIRMAWLRLNPN